MATTRFIDITLRSKKAEGSVDRLDRKMKGLGKTTDSTIIKLKKLLKLIEKPRTINVKINTATAQKKLNKLDQQTKDLGVSAKKTTKDFNNLSRTIGRTRTSGLRGIGAGASIANRDLNTLNRTTIITKESMFSLSQAAIAVTAALAVRRVVRYADAFTSLQNQLRQTTKTSEELTQRTEDLLNISNRSRVGISATAELFTQLTLATENLNLTTDEQLRLTETISKSFAVSGKTAAESAGAIRQLGQAFSAGALRGDEFNSIAENAPEIMRALKRETGLTAGELREFAATGGITAKILVDALGSAADVIDEKMNKAVKTFGQNMEIANNNMTIFIGESAQVQNVVAGAGNALVAASENVETLTKFIVLGATIFATRMIPAITSYTSAVVTNSIAQLSATKQTTGFSAAMGIQAAAATRSTIAVNSLSIAAKGATAAMTLLGGPLGAALLAATAILLFVDAAELAEERTSRLSGEVNVLTRSFSKLTAAQRVTETSRINNEFKTLSAELVIANDRLVKVREGVFFRGKASIIAGLEDEVNSLNEQLDVLSVKRQAIFAGGIPAITGTTEAPADKKESKFIIRLKLETEALERELRARQLISEGILNEEEANLALRFDNKAIQDLTKFEAELTKLGNDEAAKAELRAAFEDQQLITAQLFEQALTDVQEEETGKRISLNQLELQSKVSTFQAVLGAAAAFGVKSEKLNKAVRIAQGALSAYQIFAATEAAAALALAQPPGPPSTIPFAASISAAGKVKAGAVLAGAVGGAFSTGGGGISASRPSVPTVPQVTPTPTAQELPQQTRVVDIRIDDNALLTGSMFKEAMNSIFESDTDIIVNITNQQAEAVRTGAI